MSLKNEFKREFNNIKKELAAAVETQWKIDYKGQEITIFNKVKSEEMYFNGQLVASKTRNSIFAQLAPYVHLKAKLELEDGSKHFVHAKIGGFVSLKCIVKIDKEVVLDSSIKLDFLPWDNKPKIVPFILEQLESGTLSDDLPDDVLLFDENHPKIAPGLGDHLIEKIQTPFLVNKLVKLLGEQLQNPSEKTRKAIYEKVIYDHITTYGGDFIRAVKEKDWEDEKIQEEAKWFLENAAHREVVKFALVLLGTTKCDEYKELIRNIGRHEEFTGYAILALKKGTYQWNESVFELATSLNGWGKIAAVSILNPTSKEIKEWLITSGCENNVANEALAYTCAVKGDLDVALEEEVISEQLFNGVTKIISSLLSKQATETMDDYAYAQEVMMEYLRHAKTMLTSQEHFNTIIEIDNYINEDDDVWETRYNGEWRPHLREAVKKELAYFKNEKQWLEKAQKDLETTVSSDALATLKFFDIDITDIVFEKLKDDSSNIVLITEVIKMDDQLAMNKLCSIVLDTYDFDSLTMEQLIAFQVILDYLDDYEGSGKKLVYHALNYDLEGVQEKGLYVLNVWNPSVWKSSELIPAIENILKNSNNKNLKNLAKQILNR